LLLHFAFLLSDAGNPLSVCLRQNLYEEEKTISNQPIIFNITYTPWKLKSNATVQERKKFEQERPYYEMSNSENNIYKYMTSDRKLNGENSKSEMRDMISYFEKSTGVFKEALSKTQEEIRKTEKAIEKQREDMRMESGVRRFLFWATPIFLLAQTIVLIIALL